LPVTSALLFVALLVVVDLSYRRWVRRSRARRRVARRVDAVRVDAVRVDAVRVDAVRVDLEIVLDAPDASVLEMRARRETLPDQHRST
jgi:hypothetical protein